jgi:hypothetical protein
MTFHSHKEGRASPRVRYRYDRVYRAPIKKGTGISRGRLSSPFYPVSTASRYRDD